ncbi:MAG: ferredoxin-type protein NapG [Candidatus Thioglobus sp.]|jgi:ferredoxin-type protein NapG|uniref:ferredoxin-type protein NapG n=1 Tax=Candidatus Thioglobus sp. TaxID=2026721 RepID=UPI0001BAC55D|nr:ferredoxin-type protein NapG [Candidatus Thioglobus sp.]ACX30476.1 MauM/NapG ferredoxin-type protein [uncultured Candidatus Thioglobus sp.]EEZ79718.1 MAG: MauM/NapG ferredoxin-type protein [uncultured Candidatus Thioglobus sp.]MBT3186495.1 ferredoxin-type protein NapG [Candidatus Thioglobus sp.]MBT3431182.1 ferredoxin-type protein NapG [Candidatus Thioglobus sp.]MBT4922919.1 ferredoxin-type protein NapG [Candidatus Thioglobus sp.]
MAISRREFFINSARLATTTALVATGLLSYSKYSYSLPAKAIRPPGALSEKEFVSACVRCGLCVNDCPFPTLSLATLEDDVALGTPFFTAREAGCEMCDDIPCVKACPTGALDKNLTDINDAKMGLARIVDTKGCIAYQGLRCEVCYNVCPIRGKAITVEVKHNKRSGKHALFVPVVNYDYCTGCGKCEEACIMEEAVIRVLPIKLAMGKRQDHYKLGWEEKQKSGQSLVTPDLKHKYNLPEGKKYDLQGEGLTDVKIDSTLDNALESLNKFNPLFDIKRK